MDGLDSLPVLVGTAVAGIVVVIVIFVCRRSAGSSESETDPTDGEFTEKDRANASKASKKKVAKPKKAAPPQHPFLVADLKGHTGNVFSVAFDPSGDYVVSSSADRTVRVWYSNEFSQKEHKYHRINVELDQARCVRFSPDSRALVTALDDARAVRVFKLNRKKDGSVQGHSVALDFPKSHDSDLVSVAIASTGKYILTASDDTHLSLWNLKGDLIHSMDTKQVTTHWADISPCGTFIASCGFTTDVLLYSVKIDQGGDIQKVERAMELKGHSAATYHFSFSQDSRRVATVSKDGTWRLWDIDVHYELQQDPRLLQKGKFEHAGHSLVSLAPNALSLAVTSGTSIFIFNCETGECEEELIDVHTSEITALTCSPSALYFCSAGGEDKHIRVWKNVVGVRASIMQLKDKLKKTSSTTVQERIKDEIKRQTVFLATGKSAIA